MKKQLVILAIIIFCQVLALEAKESAEPALKQSAEQKGELYRTSDNALLDINKTLSNAVKNNQYAIIIFGANWCHDSRGLAKTLQSPQIKALIAQHYQLLYVDVGFLDKIKPAITHLSVPVIYATPTVLIVEPSSLTIVNRDNMNLWRDAAKVTSDHAFNYFSFYANSKDRIDPAIDLQNLAALNRKIQKFERRVSKRLYQGFAMISPLLKARVAGETVDDFIPKWKAFAAFRYQVSNDIERLRKQAIAIASSKSKSKKLIFPVYQPLEWEL